MEASAALSAHDIETPSPASTARPVALRPPRSAESEALSSCGAWSPWSPWARRPRVASRQHAAASAIAPRRRAMRASAGGARGRGRPTCSRASATRREGAKRVRAATKRRRCRVKALCLGHTETQVMEMQQAGVKLYCYTARLARAANVSAGACLRQGRACTRRHATARYASSSARAASAASAGSSRSL